MAINPSDKLNERDSGAAFVRKANKLLGQAGVDLGATEAARDAAGGHAAQADSAAASAAISAAYAAQVRAGQRQGGPLIKPTLLLDWVNNQALDPRVRYSRAGDAWEANPAGILTRYGANVWPLSGGRSLWPAMTNKVTARKHNPSDLTGITTPNAEDVSISLVQDVAALAASGLSSLCSNGNVYRVENRAAAPAPRWVIIRGPTGNTNDHTVSAYARRVGEASAALRLSYQDSPGVAPPVSSAYSRISVLSPAASNTREAAFVLWPGAVVYFIVPQLTETSYLGPVIPGDTLAATARAADTNLLPMSPWFNPLEGTFAVKASAAPGNGRLFHLSRGIGSGGVRAQMQTNSTGARQIAMVDEGGVVTVAGMLAGNSGVGGTSVFAYGRDGIAAIGPGQASIAKNPATIPAGLAMAAIGCDTGGVSQLGSSVQLMAYYPRRVSDAEMLYMRDTL